MRYMTLFLLAGLAVLSACAQTTMTRGSSFTDPGWNGAPARSVIVDVQNAPLNERTAIENSVVSELAKAGIRAAPSHQLFLPTRDYGLDERRDILTETGYETHLVIRPFDRDIERHYTPPEPEPFGAFGYGTYGWGTGIGVGINSGLYREEPIVSYASELFIIAQNRKIWTGDYRTRGASGMTFTEVGNRFGRYIVDKLRADGLI